MCQIQTEFSLVGIEMGITLLKIKSVNETKMSTFGMEVILKVNVGIILTITATKTFP